jgi:hypothetical protein
MHTAGRIDLIHRASIHSRHRLPAASIPTAGPRSRQLHDIRTHRVVGERVEPARVGRGPLVGRDRELGRLEKGCRISPRGHPADWG